MNTVTSLATLVQGMNLSISLRLQDMETWIERHEQAFQNVTKMHWSADGVALDELPVIKLFCSFGSRDEAMRFLRDTDTEAAETRDHLQRFFRAKLPSFSLFCFFE